jgi:hypothetical protein
MQMGQAGSKGFPLLSIPLVGDLHLPKEKHALLMLGRQRLKLDQITAAGVHGLRRGTRRQQEHQLG